MLKASSHDQLSKIWKPLTIWQPFYKGGKLQISKDGQKIACEFEGNLKFVSTSDTSSASSFFDDDVPFEAVQCFAVHPNWKEVVIATVKFSISHWIIEGKQQQKTMKAHRMPILCMEYDSTGSLVATGSADRTVRVWDVVRGYCTHVFSEHSDLIKSVFFHQPKGKGGQLFLVSTSEDNSVAFFDLVQQKKQAHFTSEHVSVPTKAVVTCEDRLLVSCGRDKVLNFFSLKTLQHLKVVPVVEELEAMTCLPDQVSRRLIEKSARKEEFLQNSKHSSVHLLVTAGVKGVLRFFVIRMDGDDVASLQVSLFFNAPLSSLPQQSTSEEVAQLCGVTHLDYLTQSEEIFVSTNDFNLCHYSLDVLGRYIESHGTASITSSLIHHSVASTSSLPRLTPSHLLVGHHGDVLDVISLPRSGAEEELSWQGLLVTNSPQLRLVSTSTSSAFRCEKMFEGHSDIILAVDVTPDGQYVVTSAKDKTVRVWSVALGDCVAVGEGHTDAIGAVCVSHFQATYQSRKAFVVSGASDKILKKWLLPTHSFSTTSPVVAQRLTSTQSIRAHDKDINCVTVAPNDSLVASASQDKTIRLWNPDDLSAIATLHGHKRGVWKVVFSPADKGVLMSCSGDRTVKIWSLTDFTVLKTLEGNTASVLNLRLTHGGDQCITAAADGLLRLFTLRSQECISTMEEHDDRVWAIDSFHTASDHYLVSGGSDSKLVLWKDVTKEEEALAIQQREEKVQLEQQLYNYISKKNYLPALQLALQLKYSQRVLSILQTIIEDTSSATSSATPYDTEEQLSEDSVEFQEKGGNSQRISEKFQRLFERQWSKCLDSYLLQLSDAHRIQLVVFLKDWNTNSRHCYLCQLIFNAFLRLFHASSLLHQSEWREVVAGFRAYTERHHARVNRLLQASYYINYVIASMQGFLPLETLNRITHNAPDNKDDVTRTTQKLLKEVQEEEQEITYVITKFAEEEKEKVSEEEEAESGKKRSFEEVDRSVSQVSKKKKTKKA